MKFAPRRDKYDRNKYEWQIWSLIGMISYNIQENDELSCSYLNVLIFESTRNPIPLDTGRKVNFHKTWRPYVHSIYVLCSEGIA